jgi:hypothetical protein
MTTPAAPITTPRRAALNRRARRLAYATAGYNLGEGIVAVAAGAAASSTALIGFGLDSFVEVSCALVVIWQFRARLPETRERLALRLIGLSFFALAGWVGFESVRSLLGDAQAEPSPVGIGLATASLIVMPVLVWAKRRTGRQLGSATVIADSMQTLLCTYLSAILLAGLLLNATLGWSWADPRRRLPHHRENKPLTIREPDAGTTGSRTGDRNWTIHSLHLSVRSQRGFRIREPIALGEQSRGAGQSRHPRQAGQTGREQGPHGE